MRARTDLLDVVEGGLAEAAAQDLPRHVLELDGAGLTKSTLAQEEKPPPARNLQVHHEHGLELVLGSPQLLFFGRMGELEELVDDDASPRCQGGRGHGRLDAEDARVRVGVIEGRRVVEVMVPGIFGNEPWMTQKRLGNRLRMRV